MSELTKYIWQQKFWPQLRWDQALIKHDLSLARNAQLSILAQQKFFEKDNEVEIFIEEAFTTSAIEGETLDRASIRSSVAKRLGLPTGGLPQVKINSDGLVQILIDATTNYNKQLTHKRLYSWQAALFPTGYSGMNKITTGCYRFGEEPMQVVSGALGREIVHYKAPPSQQVFEEMKTFIDWWNTKKTQAQTQVQAQNDGILQAAIAHLWFISIHPFDDGNGRIARVITDMALAKDEKVSRRLYSLSSEILKDKKNYYKILEETQKSDGDITQWLIWFLKMFTRSIEHSKTIIEKTLFVSQFYKSFADKNLNDRQWKVIKKLLEYLPLDFVGGLTNRKYVALTGVSSETAKRDLKELLDLKILLQNEKKGRSTSYRLNHNFTRQGTA